LTKKVLKYSKLAKMTDEKVFQAIIENYYVDTLEGCIKQEKIEIKNEFKTEIK